MRPCHSSDSEDDLSSHFGFVVLEANTSARLRGFVNLFRLKVFLIRAGRGPAERGCWGSMASAPGRLTAGKDPSVTGDLAFSRQTRPSIRPQGRRNWTQHRGGVVGVGNPQTGSARRVKTGTQKPGQGTSKGRNQGGKGMTEAGCSTLEESGVCVENIPPPGLW